MSRREVESRFARMAGQTKQQAEWVEKQTKDLEWFAFERGTGRKLEGTKAELLRLNDEARNAQK